MERRRRGPGFAAWRPEDAWARPRGTGVHFGLDVVPAVGVCGSRPPGPLGAGEEPSGAASALRGDAHPRPSLALQGMHRGGRVGCHCWSSPR